MAPHPTATRCQALSCWPPQTNHASHLLSRSQWLPKFLSTFRKLAPTPSRASATRTFPQMAVPHPLASPLFLGHNQSTSTSGLLGCLLLCLPGGLDSALPPLCPPDCVWFAPSLNSGFYSNVTSSERLT